MRQFLDEASELHRLIGTRTTFMTGLGSVYTGLEGVMTAIANEIDGYEGARLLLRMRNRPTAIFATNDVMAFGAEKAIREAQVSDQELAEAKAFLIGSFPLRLDSTAKLAHMLAQVEFF